MNAPYRLPPAPSESEIPNFRAPSKKPSYVALSGYYTALLAALVLEHAAPRTIGPAALFVLARITYGLILVTVMIAPIAREFLAVRRARRLAGWR